MWYLKVFYVYLSRSLPKPEVYVFQHIFFFFCFSTSLSFYSLLRRQSPFTLHFKMNSACLGFLAFVFMWLNILKRFSFKDMWFTLRLKRVLSCLETVCICSKYPVCLKMWQYLGSYSPKLNVDWEVHFRGLCPPLNTARDWNYQLE